MNEPVNLVIGPTGGIGRATTKSLLELNHKTRLFGRNADKIRKFFPDPGQYSIFIGEMDQPDSLYKAMDGVTHIYYCINVPYQHWHKKSIPFLETCIEIAVKTKAKIVFPGNVYSYGRASYNPVDEAHPHHPHTSKGKIRLQMEEKLDKMHQEYGNDYVIVRMPDFYGPYVINGFSEKFYLDALKNKKLRWPGKLDVPVELVFIDDGGKAMVTAGLADKGANTDYNVPGYREITARKFLEMIIHYAGSKSEISSITSPLLISLAGLVNPTIREYKEMMYLKTEKLILSGKKFRETFGMIPATTYDLGVQKTLKWVKTFYNV